MGFDEEEMGLSRTGVDEILANSKAMWMLGKVVFSCAGRGLGCPGCVRFTVGLMSMSFQAGPGDLELLVRLAGFEMDAIGSKDLERISGWWGVGSKDLERTSGW